MPHRIGEIGNVHYVSGDTKIAFKVSDEMVCVLGEDDQEEMRIIPVNGTASHGGEYVGSEDFVVSSDQTQVWSADRDQSISLWNLA